MKGESIPTQARLIAIARWLDVDPGWLRFGSPAVLSTALARVAMKLEPDVLRKNVSLLTRPNKKLVSDFVLLLLNMQKVR